MFPNIVISMEDGSSSLNYYQNQVIAILIFRLDHFHQRASSLVINPNPNLVAIASFMVLEFQSPNPPISLRVKASSKLSDSNVIFPWCFPK